METETRTDPYRDLVAKHAYEGVQHMDNVGKLLALTTECHLNRLGGALGDDKALKLIAHRLVKLNDARVTFEYLRRKYAMSEDGSDAQAELNGEINSEVWDALEQMRYADNDVTEYLKLDGSHRWVWADPEMPFPKLA
jgi:hypothetical protein